MLITFTTEHGNLVIRAEDLRRLEDGESGCMLGWVEEAQRFYAPILGTAAENRDHIVQQEAAAIAAYELSQRQVERPLYTRGGKVKVRQ